MKKKRVKSWLPCIAIAIRRAEQWIQAICIIELIWMMSLLLIQWQGGYLRHEIILKEVIRVAAVQWTVIRRVAVCVCIRGLDLVVWVKWIEVVKVVKVLNVLLLFGAMLLLLLVLKCAYDWAVRVVRWVVLLRLRLGSGLAYCWWDKCTRGYWKLGFIVLTVLFYGLETVSCCSC